MSKIQKLIKQNRADLFCLVLVVLLTSLAGMWLLKPGYFNMHDDGQMIRQLEMEKCFLDLQIPCRWAPDMGYGYGLPLFNYYPQLPYLVGEVFRLFGFAFMDTVKYTFFLSILVSGVGMYLLCRELFGKLGGLVASSFYIWAPYHALDVFVRGAMAEVWAMSIFPFILWFSYKLVNSAQFRWIVFLAIAWAFMLLSHNLMVLVFAPVFVGWVLIWLIRERSWFTVPQFLVSLIWALGLAGFFTIPVIFESSLVHIGDLASDFYTYFVHFASISQLLFSRFWGYGRSVWEAQEDGMSFQVGHLHWILPIIVVGLVVWRYLKTRKFDSLLLVTCYFFLVGWISLFMVHSKSTPVWMLFEPILKFMQFPWRFLAIATLAFSIVAGASVLLFKSKPKISKVIAFLLIAGVVLFNKDYFKPERMGPLTDESKFSGLAWELQLQIQDYRPATAKESPKTQRTSLFEVLEGEAEIFNEESQTNLASFKAVVTSDNAQVRINIVQFPQWKIFVDGREVETAFDEDKLGRMHITIPQGRHEVIARFSDTPIRTASNFLSAFSWILLFTVPLWRRR